MDAFAVKPRREEPHVVESLMAKDQLAVFPVQAVVAMVIPREPCGAHGPSPGTLSIRVN